MSLLTLSRWQFAITVIFHMTFPAITVGTPLLLCVLYGMHWRTGKPVYLQMFRFWRRIFAFGFAIGVVAGIVITCEFGLDWGVFAAKTGPIMGPILGMEVVTAFFVEAGFIGSCTKNAVTTSMPRIGPMAGLVRELAATRTGHAAIGRPASVPWLFPGGRPGHPLDGRRLGDRLRNIGLHPRQGRATALFTLASQLPA